MSNIDTWDRAAIRYEEEYDPPIVDVPFGPGLPSDGELRILPGQLGGRRVLELGCGAGQAAVAFARKGARTIALDSSALFLHSARTRAEERGVRVDFHHGDLCELAFVPADSIDLVFSTGTLDYVEDIGRVFRSVHRVLRGYGAFVFTLEHPMALATADPGRDYGDPTPFKADRYGETFLVYPRTFAEVISGLTRAGFRPEAMAEPLAAGQPVPAAAVWRARKDR